MTLIMNDAQPWHWSIVGAALGVLTLLLLYISNVRLGMSSGFDALCSLWRRKPYFRRAEVRRTQAQRLVLFAGCALGGFLSAQLSGGWHPTWSMGRFDTLVSDDPKVKVAWMFVGGVLVGFGTRLGSGCTSGHAVFGFPFGDRASVRGMFAFMAAGILASNLTWRVLFPS